VVEPHAHQANRTGCLKTKISSFHRCPWEFSSFFSFWGTINFLSW